MALPVALVAALVSVALNAGCGAVGQTNTSAVPSPGRLVDSRASDDVVQSQPAPGSCHPIGSGLYSRPDPRCTPGALNPQVTQANIGQTICKSGWTATVRPPEQVTEAEKRASMAAYGDDRPLSDYEYDHFVPLGLGGATNDARNLWPEPGASPNPKDAVEDELNRSVCEGRMTLAQAQRAIVTNWVALARGGARVGARPLTSTSAKPPTTPRPTPAANPRVTPTPTPAANPQATPTPTPAANPRATPKPPPTSAANCSASAQFSSRYGDYDVFVHSDQPDHKVTVTAANGTSASWHTDNSGSANVYFQAARADAGARVTVRVGAATCSTAL